MCNMGTVFYLGLGLLAFVWFRAPLVTSDLQSCQSGAICHRYDEHELNTTQCTRAVRRHDDSIHGDFSDMYQLMNNALNHEMRGQFVVTVVEQMYSYIHCASKLEAVADLYFGVPEEQWPPPESLWWTEACSALQFTDPALVGRKRQAPNDNDVFLVETMTNEKKKIFHKNFMLFLMETIHNITEQTNPACVQWLIHQFQDEAKVHFHREYPNFPDPTLSTSTTAMTTTTTTTTATTTTTTTTATPTTPLQAVHCYNCTHMSCLLSREEDVTVTCPGGLCKVVMQMFNNGTGITRSCGSAVDCQTDTHNNLADCEHADTARLDLNTRCSFCCQGDTCNRPPRIKPLSGLWQP